MKSVRWVGSSRKELSDFPLDVKSEMGFALYQAQIGKRHVNTKIVKGMGDAGILEIVEDYRGDTFRAVYTVRFQSAVYVLHEFQKKSVKGSATPKPEIDLIERRLRIAQQIDQETSRDGHD